MFAVTIEFKGFSDMSNRIGRAVSLIKVIMNTVIEANIEDKEEYLNIKDTSNQVNINKKAN